jgi:phenylpropionate dioxygenase-like ring-hydroxylating dioxygenase large terminal subunit
MTIHQEERAERLAFARMARTEAAPAMALADVGKMIPRAWYMVARSADLPRAGDRRVVSRDLFGHALVLFRASDGALHCFDAHCPHMGTHLGAAAVNKDCLQCPMHHWRFNTAGHCGGGGGDAGRNNLRTWPIAERYGAVFVFMGPEPLFDLPRFDLPDAALLAATGRSVDVQCPWISVSANAYDMQHLRTVHGRALRDPPVVERLDPYRLRLRYVSRVTGTGLADRIMKWLSEDTIRVTITCYGGPLFTVESTLKSRQSLLLLGIMPTTSGVTITPVFIRKRGGIPAIDRVGIALAGWLFMRFLEKDLGALHRMRFRVPDGLTEEDPLQQFLTFVAALPALPHA